jgi:hypothetical protein
MVGLWGPEVNGHRGGWNRATVQSTIQNLFPVFGADKSVWPAAAGNAG